MVCMEHALAAGGSGLASLRTHAAATMLLPAHRICSRSGKQRQRGATSPTSSAWQLPLTFPTSLVSDCPIASITAPVAVLVTCQALDIPELAVCNKCCWQSYAASAGVRRRLSNMAGAAPAHRPVCQHCRNLLPHSRRYRHGGRQAAPGLPVNHDLLLCWQLGHKHQVHGAMERPIGAPGN